ncbi:MAG: hypothetical protein ABI649_02690 [Gaiellaceae bacterium]
MATRAHDAEDRHQAKAARNQTLMREVNERIEFVLKATDNADFICECADLRCNARLELTIAEYEAVRTSSSIRFPIKPGHDIPDLEQVVERNSRFVVVQKISEAAASSRKLASTRA